MRWRYRVRDRDVTTGVVVAIVVVVIVIVIVVLLVGRAVEWAAIEGVCGGVIGRDAPRSGAVRGGRRRGASTTRGGQ